MSYSNRYQWVLKQCGVIEPIGTNSPMMGLEEFFTLRALFEGRPFASADADRILVKKTGKDDVGWIWLNLVESLPESKVGVGKCDMHIHRNPFAV